jgi:hypothetical protein
MAGVVGRTGDRALPARAVGLRRLGTAAALVGLTVAPAWALVDPDVPAAAVAVHADGRVGVHLDRAVPLADLVREIGTAIGAEVTVRRDPGAVGPIAVDPLPAGDLLLRLAGRHSLVLHYADDRVARIILVAYAPATAAQAVPVTEARPEPLARPAPASAEAAMTEQAAQVRDIDKLSYQDDDAARAELARHLATGVDPAVRAAAAAALVGSGRADPGLVTLALGDADPEVRLRAAQGLWVAQGDAAALRLRGLAASDPAPEVRAAVADLLATAPPSAR